MKFVISASSSGGHWFPALCVANELKARGHSVVFMGSFGFGEAKIKDKKYPVYSLRLIGMTSRNIIVLLKCFVLMVAGTVKAFVNLLQIKPDLVIGFGGYGSVAVACAARILNIPVFIHEQNVEPGKATRFLSLIATKTAFSFDQTLEYIKPKSYVVTGCPSHQKDLVKKTKEDVLSELGLRDDKKTILVLGGSQGSQRINQEMIKFVSQIGGNNKFQFIHICGQGDYDRLKSEYVSLGIGHVVFDFFDKIDDLYLVSDLAVSRAGAVSVTELAEFELPALLIPYPYAGGHQLKNAKMLLEVGLAKIIEEKDIDSQMFKTQILDMIDRKVVDMAKLQKKNQYFKPNAARHIASEAVSLCG